MSVEPGRIARLREEQQLRCSPLDYHTGYEAALNDILALVDERSANFEAEAERVRVFGAALESADTHKIGEGRYGYAKLADLPRMLREQAKDALFFECEPSVTVDAWNIVQMAADELAARIASASPAALEPVSQDKRTHAQVAAVIKAAVGKLRHYAERLEIGGTSVEADALEALALYLPAREVNAKTAHWASDLGGLQEARSVLQQARASLLDQQRQNTHVHNVYWPALGALEPALSMLAGLVDRAESATTAADPSQPPECPHSPNGRHQVDTSMETGSNNCFFCQEPMGRL